MSSKSGEYEGRLVGDRRLDSLLGVRGNTAFYTSQSATGTDQLVELIPVDAASAATVASWNRARDLAAERFLTVHATGKAELDGTRVAYAILDMPDDDLGEILSRRKLDEKEARFVFSGVASALYELHERGLAHGAVKPSNIFVVGDAIRMSVDTIAPAGKQGKERDLHHLGATIVKAMTGCSDDNLVDAPAIAGTATRLAAPFRQIVIGCVGGSSRLGWTARRIVETLSGHRPAKVSRAPVRWPIFAAAGTAVLAILLYLLFFRGTTPPAPVTETAQVTPPPVAAQTATPPQPAPQPTAQEPPPQKPSPSGVADRNVTPPPPPSEEKTVRSWAVIAGAYHQFEAAQKHADIYGRRFPQLHPHVFPPEGQGRRYLIVLASAPSQDAADRLRADLVEQGAPHDVYVTRIEGN